MRIKSSIILFGYIIYTFQFYRSDRNLKQNLFNISFHMKSILGFICFVIFCLKLESIYSLLNSIDNHLDDKNRKCVNTMSIILAIIWIVSVVTNGLFFLVYVKLFYKELAEMNDISGILWSIQAVGWLLSTYCLKISVCYAIYVTERTSFRRVTASAIRSDRLYQQLTAIIKLKKSVNNSLGFLPMIWFCLSFSNSCLRLTHIVVRTDRTTNIADIVYDFYEYGLIQLFNLAYVSSICYYQVQRPDFDDILGKYHDSWMSVADNKSIIMQNSLHNLINTYVNLEYRVWHVFKLNATFIFSLINTIIIFTVMLIQLINAWIFCLIILDTLKTDAITE